jgi:acyl phosphate:glycerol-3-phosphate acyltransferase
MTFLFILLIIISYLLGSIPTAVIVGRILGVDVRRNGSCNPGATNVTRLTGKRGWGALVLSIDALKGFLPTAFGPELLAIFGAMPGGMDVWLVRVILGSTAIVGHGLSIFLAFHGGKGVATSLGVSLALAPWVGVACFVIWAIMAELTRRISVSSLVAGLALPILLSLKTEVHREAIYFSWILPLFLTFTHRQNLIRLFKGDEPAIAREKLVGYLLFYKKWR